MSLKSGLSVQEALLLIFFLILCSIHMLLPIENGFPEVTVAGLTIPLTVIVGFFLLGVLLITSGGEVVFKTVDTFVALQMIVIVCLCFSVFVSSNMSRAVKYVLLYTEANVVMYLIIKYIFKSVESSRRLFPIVLCTVAMISALITYVEGLFSIRLEFYDNLFHNKFDVMFGQLQDGNRALGTYGHPILVSVGLLTVIPFAVELKSRMLSIGVIAAVIGAAALTLSRSGLVILFCYGLRMFVISKNKSKFLIILLGIGSVVLLIGVATALSDSEFGDLWLSRLGIGSSSRNDTDALSMRTEMTSFVLKRVLSRTDPLEIALGEGFFSSFEVGGIVSRNLQTIDNGYLTLAMENGILGLTSYVVVAVYALTTYFRKASNNLHFYSIVSLYLLNFSFVTMFNNTTNFSYIASFAILAIITENSKQPSTASEPHQKVLMQRDPLSLPRTPSP